MKTFGWSEYFVLKRLDGARGWVYANWARENDAGFFGTNEERKTDGYIKAEIKRIKANQK